MFSNEIQIPLSFKQEKTSCYHCGDTCSTLDIYSNNKYFCCSGCQSVYEILENNNLCEFYNINDTAGKKINQRDFELKYQYLDNTEIQQLMLDFKSDSFSKCTFFIPDIHCSSCIYLLENLHKINPGVIKSEVNYHQKKDKS